jgi:hypothetical protein
VSNAKHQPSNGEHMKNKTFQSRAKAYEYFWNCATDYICFLIRDYENDRYQVIDEDTLDYLQNDFNLHMDVIIES